MSSHTVLVRRYITDYCKFYPHQLQLCCAIFDSEKSIKPSAIVLLLLPKAESVHCILIYYYNMSTIRSSNIRTSHMTLPSIHNHELHRITKLLNKATYWVNTIYRPVQEAGSFPQVSGHCACTSDLNSGSSHNCCLNSQMRLYPLLSIHSGFLAVLTSISCSS